MKKIFKSLMFLVMGAFALASCEDVPAPYVVPEEGGGTDEGTLVTCAEAVEQANALADGATSTETYTITGYITEVVGSVSNNQQTFWMADTKDGGRVFEAYWANLPEGVSAFAQGAKVKITGKLTKYVNSSGVVTPEIKNATVEIIEAADEGGGETEEGTLVTCAEAVEQTNALADGATSTEVYTVTGYITEVVGNVSKNQQTFWMADSKDGGRVFEAYWANLPEGVSAFAQGAKVKITGKLTKYVNSSGVVTPEIKNATVEIIEAADEGGGETEEGTLVTCAEAVEQTNALADGATSTEVYTVTGYITEVVGNVSKNQQTFWMADSKDGGRVFEAYWANLPEGVSAFAQGAKVKITGKLTKYVNSSGVVTPEIKNATVEIIEAADEGGTDDPGTSTTSDYMSIANLPSNITTNSYGTQKVSDETTWLSWTWNDVTFKGVKVCKATDANGACIQMQGNASDASKQGFIFNSSAWSANIQKITIILKVATSSTYDPAYTLYVGQEAHPTTTAITPSSQSEEADGFRVYTQVFDLANTSAKYFTIANNQQGALYIDKIYVE